ncbi:BAI1-associated protein 3-like isoform X4 [Varroa destructor]|uniref:BAI1-associated protein 3 n=1 Tax=Varroa destructor TaxID=109461 RepID=A0A7M7JJX9_VARDE|nr:BAI1-associated protein 3-like isoform X4 [Varroa destructor]
MASSSASRRRSSRTVTFERNSSVPGILTKIAKHLSCHPEYHVYDGEVFSLRRKGSDPSEFNHERYHRHHRASKSFASPPGYHNHPRRNSNSRPPDGFGLGTVFCVRRKSMVEYYRVQESDGGFFENFTALSWRQENRRLQVAREEEVGRELSSIPCELDVLPQAVQQPEVKMTKKELEDLYVEVLYTIKHKLGGGVSYAEAELFAFAQDAFGMSNEAHQRLLSVAAEEKPPIPVLNVVVVEAQGLEAKDPNGYSDPYCMLGIQPGSVLQQIADRRNSSDEDQRDERERKSSTTGSPSRSPSLRSSFRNKLGASFKRREHQHHSRSRSNSLQDTLPAKFIRTTTVKPSTLNPKWNERFRLDIDDIHSDRLHLDVWDHDDESSVFDAARKLNEVAGLKGLGRYFKQIAQSARSGSSTDDFLGCVNVPLEDIPSSGIDRWIPLEGRTTRSSVQGQIRLRLSLGTREDRGLAQCEDNWKEVVEHHQLLDIFIQHTLANYQKASEWPGEVARAAQTILHQHAIQGDLSELQQSLSRWVAISKRHQNRKAQPLDYALLHSLLEDVDTKWEHSEKALSRDEEASLAESFNNMIDLCLQVIAKHRSIIPVANLEAEHKMVHMLKCLSLIYKMKAFKWCCPFRNQLTVEVINALKKGATEWFNATLQHQQEHLNGSGFTEERATLTALSLLVNAVNSDIQRGEKYHNHLFETFIGINYIATNYKQFEKMISDEVAMRLQNEVHDVLAEKVKAIIAAQENPAGHTIVFSGGPGSSDPHEDAVATGIALFELYMALQEFAKFRQVHQLDDGRQLAVHQFQLWFTDAVQSWFIIAKGRARLRIRKALEIDRKLRFVDTNVQYSTSAVDTTACFGQIKEFWKQLSWPDPRTAYPFVLRILEAICDGSIFYGNLCHMKLTTAGYYDEDGQFDVTEEMRPDVKKFLFHLAWAPEKVATKSALAPLVDYLDTNLKVLYNNLMRVNFYRVLEAVWRVVLQELTITARNNVGEQANFFQRLFTALGHLIEFFHGDDKGLSLKSLHSLAYQDLDRLLKLHKADTQYLIEMYCLQRLEEQRRQNQSASFGGQASINPYGYLTVKTFYNASGDCLTVDVMNARDLLPLDPNGYSDPFVLVELQPRHLFPNCPQHRTRVQKRTLYPIFDETFEFSVTVDKCRQEVALMCFTVMDHDMMTRNDFEGEAFLPLTQIPGVNGGENIRNITPMDLPLLQPKEKNEILGALEARQWDRDAQEFVKHQKRRKM